MDDLLLLGMFHRAETAADTIERLHTRLGIPDNRISVMSSIPYSAAILGRKRRRDRLVPIALLGALAGLLVGLFFPVGTPLLYPLTQGGQPLIPIPPTLLILFELTMMGTLLVTFAGFVTI